MNMVAILTAVAVIGVIGLFVGLFLGIAAQKLKVETDPREEAVLEALPGNNCGGCGYPGCSGLAAAIAKGEAPVNQCPVGGEAVAKKIGEIMGVDAGASEKMIAFVKCSGDCDKTFQDYDYQGIEDCRMLSFVPNGGPKSCNYGCLGFGSCVKVCPFDAIHVENGIAKVDEEKCKACGKCVAVCPKHIIDLVPYDSKYRVSCSSKDKGPIAMKGCKVSCIGCGMCKKNCPNEAIEVADFLATIDYSKCVNCGTCMEKCPKKSIHEINH